MIALEIIFLILYGLFSDDLLDFSLLANTFALAFIKGLLIILAHEYISL